MNGNPRKMFRGMFNPEESRREIKKLIDNIPIPEIDKKVGKPIEITGRTIYPIIQTLVTRNEDQGFAAIEIFPIALVVEEPDNKYVISLTDEEINQEEIIEMISSKK